MEMLHSKANDTIESKAHMFESERSDDALDFFLKLMKSLEKKGDLNKRKSPHHPAKKRWGHILNHFQMNLISVR